MFIFDGQFVINNIDPTIFTQKTLRADQSEFERLANNMNMPKYKEFC